MHENDTTKRRATIKDVAEKAGVSLSTVSHVINGTAKLTPKTCKTVEKAIQELNYTPNALARGLRQRNTKLVGVVVPDISNEFYAGCASGILAQADDAAYTVLLCDTGYSHKREKTHIETLIEHRVDGLIFIGGSNDDLVNAAKKEGISIVLGDRFMDEIHSICFNSYDATTALIARLKQAGHTNIGYVSESLDMVNLKQRYNTYKVVMKENSLSFNDSCVLIDSRLQLNKFQNAKLIMKEFLAGHTVHNLPQVFLTSNDFIAMGLIEALEEAGLQVPVDIGVVGFDDIMFAQHYKPTLTTIHQPAAKLGAECFNLLSQRIYQNTPKNYITEINTNLMIRNSVSV